MQVVLDKKESELVELFSENAIQGRIRELAKEINSSFPANEELVVIAVLAGSILFASDLIKRLNMPIQVTVMTRNLQDM